MNITKEQIRSSLADMKQKNISLISVLTDKVELTEYAHLVHTEGEYEIWSEALQTALCEHETVIITPRDNPYYIDRQIVIGSNRHIEAHGAKIIQTPDCTVLMLRNSSTANGTHKPIAGIPRDCNISVSGGYWAESRTKRAGYGSTGKYDAERSFYGVSTLFLFNNMDSLTLTDITFAHTAGFAVQVGDITDAVFEHIRFEQCYADGLHINGNTERVICYDIKGEVGDDLVALNVYDWQNSSVNFGPMKTVLAEDLELSENSRYKAMRIEPGRYYYDDGSEVDCSLTDAVISKVRGIETFKLYYQTPGYKIGDSPERGAVGSADNLFFEDIVVDLQGPIDGFEQYKNSDPVRGCFGAFEFGANIGSISFENIDLTLHRDKYPLSYLATVGPKSIRAGEYEVFDPYLSSEVGKIVLRNIRVNGELASECKDLIREISFNDVNSDGFSTGSGKVHQIVTETV